MRRGELASLPSRVTNPRLLRDLKTVRYWQLKVDAPSKACTWAQETAGRRFATAQAIPVPIAGCGKLCKCAYLPLADGRRLIRARDEPGMDVEYSPNAPIPEPRKRRKDDNWTAGKR